MRRARIWGLAAAAGIAGLLPGAVRGQSPSEVRPAAIAPPVAARPAAPKPTPAAPSAATAPPPNAAATLTAQDLNAWLDGFMPETIKRASVAGVVVVVVKDGQVLTERGFGTSDIATGAPVDPKLTLFRPGSVSKLFTWTAVMQQVEAGKIDLDADVNTYLDFRIPPRDGKPVTMRNLMTHTPGFEEMAKNLIVADPKKVTLAENLKRWVPRRVYAPGTTPAYSNYGAALAGYIVQRVSGERFEDYVARHILQPLGMNRSTFVQPPPPPLMAAVSKGYANAASPPQPFEYVTLPPAGSLSATGDDMAKFMIAHLQDGRYGSAQILKPETARLMHTTRTALMAPLPGIELGFYDSDMNGHRAIAHGGDTQLFHSNLVLFLDDGIGIFYSQNSNGVGGGGLRQDLVQGFADRYFPQPLTDKAVDPKTAARDAQTVSGLYVSVRSAASNFLVLGNVLSQTKVYANPDGTLSVSAFRDLAGVKRYREVGPYLWREVGGRERLGFVVRNGKADRFSIDEASGIIAWERVPPAISAAWLTPALQASLLVLLLTAVGWPVLAIVRRRYGATFALSGQRALAYRFVRAAAVLALLSVGGWLYIVSLISGPHGIEAVSNSVPLILTLSALTLVATLGGLLAAVFNFAWISTTTSSWWAKVWSVLLVLAFAVGLWTAWFAKLLSFSTNF